MIPISIFILLRVKAFFLNCASNVSKYLYDSHCTKYVPEDIMID